MFSPVLRRIFPLILLAAMGLMPAIAKAQYNATVSGVLADFFVFTGGSPTIETITLAEQGPGQFPINHTVGGLNANGILTSAIGATTITFNWTGTLENVSSIPLASFGFDLIVDFSLQNGSVPLQSTVELAVLAAFDGVPDGTPQFLGAGFNVLRAGVPEFNGSGGATFIAGQAPQSFGVGDIDGSGVVDATDFVVWRAAFGSGAGNFPPGGRANYTNSLDLVINLQPIPEPSEWLMIGLGLAVLGLRRCAVLRKQSSRTT